MKIAVFMTGWDKDYLRDLYGGFQSSAETFGDDIHMYTSFAKLGSGDSFDKSEFEFYQLADLSEYDGILFSGTTVKEGDVKKRLIDWFIESGKPCVSIDEKIPGISFIGFDQGKAMQDMVDHLAEVHGVKSLGLILGVRGTYETDWRTRGVVSRAEELGLSLEPEWIQECHYLYDEGLTYGQRLLEAWSQGERIPDAIVSENDLMAAGVLDAVKGTPLFGKLIITGFDQYFDGRTYWPSITSIARPRDEVSQEGIRLLHELVEKKQPDQGSRNLRYRICLGDTCGCTRSIEFDQEKHRTAVFHNILLDRSAHLMLNSMQEQMTGRQSLEELMQPIAGFLGKIGASDGEVYLAENLTSSEPRSYRECRNKILDWHTGKKGTRAGEVKTFMPFHYIDHRMGYCMVSGVGKMYQMGIMEEFFRVVSYAIENYIQRKKVYEINQQLQRLYRVDQLTQIYNRFGMEDMGQKLYHRNCRNKVNSVFIFCDVNRLKHINDTYGHKAGDWVIKTTGKALAQLESDVSIPFRYGGDEFVLITAEDSGVNADVIRNCLNEACKDAPMQEPVEISIGVVVAPWDAPEDMDIYLNKADEAMYEEKKRYYEKHTNRRRRKSDM